MRRRLMIWLVTCGLVMAAGTLGVLAWAGGQYGDVIGRTMGMTTFALFRLFSSLETADEDASLFSGTILSNQPLLIGTGISVLSIILATELGFLQKILGTASLTMDQWAICILVSLSLIVVEEARKLLKIRTGDEPVAATQGRRPGGRVAPGAGAFRRPGVPARTGQAVRGRRAVSCPRGSGSRSM